MFIQTEETPNPLTLKFMPGQKVTEGTLEYKNKEEAKSSELATILFKNANVTNVFFGSDFISITKTEDTSWEILKPDILSKIMDFFSSGGTVDDKSMSSSDIKESYKKEDEKIVNEIKTLLDEKIKPAVAQDGGDISFIKFDEGVVFLQLRGACAGCPSSTLTLKSGIENMLKYYIPEVVSVEAIN